MLDSVKNDFSKEEQSPFHKQILQDSMNLVESSRRKMATFYSKWDHADAVYRGEILADQEDKKARDRKEPEKMVVPISYSQVQTFVTFGMSVLMQRERFFELLAVNEQSHGASRIAEALLQRDLNYNRFESKLYQFLLDIARFGVGIFKSGWVEEKQMVKSSIPIPQGDFMGIALGGQQAQEVSSWKTKYLGNKILNISPYRFFPDPSFPICRFAEGEFVASEDEYQITTLRQMEADGMISGVKYIKPLKKNNDVAATERRMGPDTIRGLKCSGDDISKDTAQSLGTVVLTEIQRRIVPSEYKIESEPLGPETYPVLYNIWYVNDSRVVKCEPANYVHNQFTFDVAEYNPDAHHLVNNGLSDSIDQLQSVLSWFINSRITSVRKVISNKIIVDPSGVEMKDIRERSPVIQLKPAVAGRGVERYIQQLPIQDVTTRHLDDAKYLKDLVQVTTGVNENIMGQFYPGRRSAQEARNATSSAASRLKTIISLVFNSAIEPLGRKMLSNLRDGLDQETVVRIVGVDPAMQGASFLKITKQDIQGDFDFEVFDGTLPSEKGFTAQALQDILVALLSQPQAAIAVGLDPRELLLEVLRLRGVRNPERFTLRQPAQEQQQDQRMAKAGILGQGPPTQNGNTRPPNTATGDQPTGFGQLITPTGL